MSTKHPVSPSACFLSEYAKYFIYTGYKMNTYLNTKHNESFFFSYVFFFYIKYEAIFFFSNIIFNIEKMVQYFLLNTLLCSITSKTFFHYLINFVMQTNRRKKWNDLLFIKIHHSKVNFG